MSNIALQDVRLKAGKIFLLLSPVLILLPFVSGAMALLIGITVALGVGNPFSSITKKLTPRFMAIAIIGIGAAMNINEVLAVGSQGFLYTACGIAAAFIGGLGLGRLFGIGRDRALLISAGTAICGGSAIAAVSATIHARDEDVTLSLALVFLLNALALLIFPPLGHWLGLDQHQFGLWAAIAIHDTSSVVAASMAYGPEALDTGTTVKLARALWIIPMTLVIGFIYARYQLFAVQAEGKGKPKKPWFILGFLCMAALFTYVPALENVGDMVAFAAKRLFVFTLFLVGVNLSYQALKTLNVKTLLHGVLLWLAVSGFTLLIITA